MAVCQYIKVFYGDGITYFLANFLLYRDKIKSSGTAVELDRGNMSSIKGFCNWTQAFKDQTGFLMKESPKGARELGDQAAVGFPLPISSVSLHITLAADPI